MKVKLYSLGVETETLDCNDIDHVDNPCYFDDVVCIHMRDHKTKLADDMVFMLEGEEKDEKF